MASKVRLPKWRTNWSSWRRQPWLIVTLVAAAVPALVMLVTLIHYSVNAPWWDQWEYIGLVDKLHHGTLGLHDLWAQHNEHRILVPRALTLLLSWFTNYNTRLEIMGNWLFNTGSFLLLISFVRRTFQKSSGPSLLLSGLIAWLMFTPLAYINWIWGFQLAFFMGVFFTILGIWILTGDRLLEDWRQFRVGLLVAAVGTYCIGNGLLIWPIGLGLLLLRRADRRHLQEWCGVGLVVIASYLYKFRRSPESLPLKTLIRQPVAVARYVCQYLGHNLATTPEGAKYTGLALILVGLIATIYLYRRVAVSRAYSWLALGAYGLGTAALAAASRLNFGVDHSMVFSYTTISITFVVAVVALVVYALSVWFARPNKIRPLQSVIVLWGWVS